MQIQITFPMILSKKKRSGRKRFSYQHNFMETIFIFFRIYIYIYIFFNPSNSQVQNMDGKSL